MDLMDSNAESEENQRYFDLNKRVGFYIKKVKPVKQETTCRCIDTFL